MLRFHLLAAAMVVVFTCPAQIFPAQQHYQFWDGTRLISLEKPDAARFSIDQKGRLPRKEINLPPGFTYLDFFNGFFRAQELERLPNGEKNWKLHSSADGMHWNLEGLLPLGKLGALKVLAVGGGKYLLCTVGGMNALVEGKESSCFALAALDDSNVLRLRSILDMGLQEPYATPVPPKNPEAEAPKPKVNRKYLLPLLGLGSKIVRSSDALAIVSERLGYIWILDTKKESPSLRLVKVFPALTEAKFRTPDKMETAILGFQPRPDGHFLLATRSEAAVLAGVDEASPPITSIADFKDKARMESRLKLENAQLEKHPEILWWDLDPTTGKLTRESAPAGMPDKIFDAAVLRKFCFRFKPDGTVEGFY